MKFNLDELQKNLHDDLMDLQVNDDSYKSCVLQGLHDINETQVKILELLDDLYDLLSNLHVACHYED